MSVSPIANRSFLHGDRKSSTTSEKIIYATLDSLALKRTTLPLQLLPIDDNKDNTAERTNELKEKRKMGAEAAVRRSSFKVDTSYLSSREHAKYLLVVSSAKPEIQETRSKIVDENKKCDTVVEQGDRKQSTPIRLDRTDSPTHNTDIDVTSIKALENTDTDLETDAIENIYSQDIECSFDNRCSSNDYEKIESVFATNACWNIQKEANEAGESLKNKKNTLCANNGFLKSKSTNDLTNKSYLDARLIDEKPLVETLLEEKFEERLLFSNELSSICEKKKKHFAKNVLHFVPEYLVKRPKRRQKKKSSLSGSLISLKTLSIDSKIGINCNTRYRSASLTREESKYLKISSPTNFVHVASATNPNLVSNENTVRFNLEQVVITHEQKCATLPLLVATNYQNSMAENRTGQPLIVPTVTKGTTTFDASSIADNSKELSATRKRDAFDVANLKRELLHELQARSVKTLESSQEVKTNEYQANVSERRITYESPWLSTFSSSRAELPANSSFLWSNRSNCKKLSEHTRLTSNENVQDNDTDERYDDVGPLNLIGQEDNYDDVGTPVSRIDGNRTMVSSTIFQDSDDIYDDVVGPCYTGNTLMDNKTEIRETEAKQEGEDEDIDDMLDNEQDVYDDVGWPSEECVNSLYAGSTTGSILGTTWINGKESEWEDLEDSGTIGLSARLANKTDLSSETQVVSSKKKSGPGQRWSRKVRRQRSRGSRKNLKSTSRSIPRESMCDVAVSLGSGSVLLVGYTEKIEKWWKKEEHEDRTAQENSSQPRTQGLVQMRVIDLDEDVDTQETSCYVDEDNASDDSTYESLRSFQPDDFSTDSETEKMDETRRDRGNENTETNRQIPNRFVMAYLEAPTRPNPPPPREVSLTRTLGRRIKMLRRTWSITKGSLGRMRRRTSVDEDHSCEENKEASNDHSHLDGGRYFSFAKHFKKSVTGSFSTFYLDGYTANDNNDYPRTKNSCNEQINSNNELVYSNTIEQLDHYSVLTDQEPLYQFYDYPIFFDSNSDDYEEVEGTTPSRSTTDLAKPGHRTLWCQTPQVINSDFLQRLSTEEKKIQETKFEILTSEASYLNSLRVLRNEFINNSSIDEMLTTTEKDKLFGGIPSVLQASEQFLAELETVWSRDPMLHGLPNILLKYADKCLDIYVAYCSNQVSIDTTLKDLRTRKGIKFVETVSQIQARPTCQSLSLHSFLMLPMQRITRLPLLADAVLSKLPVEHDDRSRWERVLSSLSYVVAECNEGARAAIKEIEMENLARKLEYSVKMKPIVLKGKHLVKNGPVVQLLTKADTEYKLTFGKRFNKTPLYLLLLTDYLLVAKYKTNTHDETYTIIDTCKRSLISLETVPEDSLFAGRNAMLLTLLENYSGHQVEYILTCETDTERQRWLEAVSPSKRGLIEETLYEAWDCPQVVALYCYSQNQPDELSLYPGDVINVFRKMSDGWYHGEKLLNGEQGWFPGNYTKEVASEHVRAKNLKQRHRFLTLNGNVSQRRTKQQSAIH